MRTGPSVPLGPVPESVVAQLTGFGAPSNARDSLLYQALSNQPDLLSGWVELAWRLRQQSKTPRRLRELMIMRGAELAHCEYELASHRRMAGEAGIDEIDLAQLSRWRESQSFSAEERAALELTEAMLVGHVPDELLDELAQLFDASERVELILTAGMYSMVPRVIDALRLTPSV
jgi:4-carboxymuconolactone decarboxylase